MLVRRPVARASSRATVLPPALYLPHQQACCRHNNKEIYIMKMVPQQPAQPVRLPAMLSHSTYCPEPTLQERPLTGQGATVALQIIWKAKG